MNKYYDYTCKGCGEEFNSEGFLPWTERVCGGCPESEEADHYYD